MLGRDIAEAEAQLREQTSGAQQAECVDVDLPAGFASVNIGGGVVDVPMVGSPPWPRDKVWVARFAQQWVCLGSVARAAQGVVISVTSDIARVVGDDEVEYFYPVSGAFSSGQRVRLDHQGRLVSALYLAEPEGSQNPSQPTVPVPPPEPTIREQWFNPVDSGNYRYGSFTGGGVEVSDNRTGVYWYDRQIEGTIPDNAQILEARLSLSEEWDNVPGTPSRLGTHNQARPSGTPGLSGAIDVFGGGQIDIMPFADALKTGAALGVGFAAGYGWRRFGPASVSGAIFVKWRV